MDAHAYIESIAAHPPGWLSADSASNIVLSSRIRLARNLADTLFPERLSSTERARVWRELSSVIAAQSEISDPLEIDMEQIEEIESQILFERHLISREQLRNSGGSGVVTEGDESLSVMVNEEDHLRIQCYAPALNLIRAWERIDRFDSSVGQNVDYAFSDRFGYLTCCPTNVGTGMRASVMLHLPALSLLDEIGAVINALSKIGLMVRGMWGEGSDIAGHMYQISNQITLGKAEVEIVNHLGHIVRELAQHEENARARLMDKHLTLLEDYVGRARGVLEYAHILSSKEAFDMLSALRLGVEAGLVTDIDGRRVDELFLMVQPAHLQMAEGRDVSPRERDGLRAQKVRRTLKVKENERGLDYE